MGQFRVVTSNSARQEEIKDTGQNCPECNSPVVPGSDHCYKCGCFFDPSGRALKPGEVTDDMIENIIMLSSKTAAEYDKDPGTVKSKQIMKYGVAGLAIGVALSFFGSLVLGLILMLGSVFFMVHMSGKVAKPIPRQIIYGGHLDAMASKYIVPEVLDKVFDKVEEYDPSGHFSFEDADYSHLVYKDYCVRDGNHYVKGIYKGKPVEFSNIRFEDYSTDEEGKRHYKTIFHGIWLGMDLGIPLGEELRITKKSLGYSMKNSIKTEHEKFNKRYFVSCKDQAAAFTFLTPQVMEAIIKMDDISGGQTSIFVSKEGYIQVAANNSKDVLRSLDLEEPLMRIRERMEEEVRTIMLIPDTLSCIYKD